MKTLILILSLCSTAAFANQFQTSVGLGHQYGGVLGAQLSYKTDSTKFYGSLGLVGAALGFQTTFSDSAQHSYGLVVGKEELQSEDGFAFASIPVINEGACFRAWVGYEYKA